MPNVRELREQRQTAFTQAQEFLARSDAGDTMTAEDTTAWDRAVGDVDTLTEQIDRLERTAALDTRFAEIDAEQRESVNSPGNVDPKAEGFRAAFDAWMRKGEAELSAEQRAQMRDQSTIVGSLGGYTVPPTFLAKVIETLKYYGGALNVVSVLDTESGNEIMWPTNDDTSNSGAILDEGTVITGQDITFGQKKLGAFTYTSKLIKVSLQLMQDTGINLEAFIGKKAGQRLGRIWNTDLTVGVGAPNSPQGIVTGAVTGATAAGATAITYDDVINLIHSVDPAYRASPACTFMFHDLILAALRKLKDTQGRPLWNVNVAAGAPPSFLDYPYVINNDMASTVATTNKTMAFGDFGEMYQARRSGGMQLVQLRERYMDQLQVGFFLFARLDGIVQDASAAKLLVQP